MGRFWNSKRLLPFLLSWQEPIGWLIDKKAKSILDVGCGQGLPMQLIKQRMKIDLAVGVDLFSPYIEECRKKKIYNQCLAQDVRRLSFKNKSFDVVIALQVLEHLTKADAWKVLEKMEKITKRQIIVSMPIGKMDHPPVDGNRLQIHRSGFYPEEFQKKGYRIFKFGRKELLGERGIVHKIKADPLKKLAYLVNIVLSPLFYLFQPLANYHFYAYKKFVS